MFFTLGYQDAGPKFNSAVGRISGPWLWTSVVSFYSTVLFFCWLCSIFLHCLVGAFFFLSLPILFFFVVVGQGFSVQPWLYEDMKLTFLTLWDVAVCGYAHLSTGTHGVKRFRLHKSWSYCRLDLASECWKSTWAALWKPFTLCPALILYYWNKQHDQRQLGEERVLLTYTSKSPSFSEENQGKNSKRDTCWNCEVKLLTGLLHMACLVPSLTSLGPANQSSVKKTMHRLVHRWYC